MAEVSVQIITTVTTSAGSVKLDVDQTHDVGDNPRFLADAVARALGATTALAKDLLARQYAQDGGR